MKRTAGGATSSSSSFSSLAFFVAARHNNKIYFLFFSLYSVNFFSLYNEFVNANAPYQSIRSYPLQILSSLCQPSSALNILKFKILFVFVSRIPLKFIYMGVSPQSATSSNLITDNITTTTTALHIKEETFKKKRNAATS